MGNSQSLDEDTFGKRKKMYYVDKHEDRAEFRKAHIEKRFLDELFQPVWVQKTKSEFERLKNEGILANSLEAHTYLNTDGEEMVEFHIDCDNGDTLLREFDSSIYGGNFSVRNQQADKKVIVLGHDESAMKQHQFTTFLDFGRWSSSFGPKTRWCGYYVLPFCEPANRGWLWQLSYSRSTCPSKCKQKWRKIFR
jgi:hypothetical protein